MAKQNLVVVAVIVSIVAMISSAPANVPQLISFQGKLHDASGNPLTGDYQITFRIYNVESGGTAIWTETSNVSCTNGLYNVILGMTNPMDLGFDGDFWLSAQVSGDEELAPRYRIVSVPVAIRAAVADSAHRVSWNNLTDVPAGFADGTDNEGAGGAGGGWVDDGTVIRLETETDKVGIGTDTPLGMLHVGSYNVEPDTRGIYARMRSSGDNAYKGIEGYVSDGSGSNFGIMGAATGSGKNYGIYGTASGSDSSWAGYFNGDVHVSDKVGVGTRSPLTNQHVQASSVSLTSGALHADNFILEDENAILGLYSNEAGIAGSAITFGEVTGGALTDKWAMVRETAVGGKGLRMTYGTNKDQFNNTTVMYLDDSGDVGIGTRSPDAKLGVEGDLKVTGAYKGNISSSSGSDGAPFPRPAYDSAWVPINQGEDLILTHGIGGNRDNYVVDMQFRHSSGVNIYGLGYEVYEGYGGNTYRFGAYWAYLNTSSIKVHRGSSDDLAAEVRIRIWVYN